MTFAITTRDAQPRQIVIATEDAKKGEILRVVSSDAAYVTRPFEVYVHRDVVAGEMLELDWSWHA